MFIVKLFIQFFFNSSNFAIFRNDAEEILQSKLRLNKGRVPFEFDNDDDDDDADTFAACCFVVVVVVDFSGDDSDSVSPGI